MTAAVVLLPRQFILVLQVREVSTSADKGTKQFSVAVRVESNQVVTLDFVLVLLRFEIEF